MCSVYAQTFSNRFEEGYDGIAAEILAHLFEIAGDNPPSVYNAWIGNNETYLFTSDAQVKKMLFGLTPYWSDKLLYLFNARAEGKSNPDNDPTYNGPMGIFAMPAFRSAIAKRRAILPVRYFIEGPEKEKLKKPFKVYRKDQKLFFVGCIWESWTDKTTGEVIDTFAMVTTASAKLLRERVKHHRSPLILDNSAIKTWLNPTATREELSALMRPFDSTEFECHPISQQFKTKENREEFFKEIEVSDC